MALKYIIKMLKNLQQSSQSSLSYLQTKVREMISTHPITHKIDYIISLAITYILILSQSYIVKINNHLANNANPNPGEFSNFPYQIYDINSFMSKKINYKTNIQEFKFHFITSKHLDYKRIIPIKAKQYPLCKEKEKLKAITS